MSCLKKLESIQKHAMHIMFPFTHEPTCTYSHALFAANLISLLTHIIHFKVIFPRYLR